MLDARLLRRLASVAALGVAVAAWAGSYEDILAAAQKNDTPQVIDLLRRGLDVNTADASGNTLLMIAARNGNMDLLDFLLRNRANALKRNSYGDSALMLATFRGHVPAVRRLLDAGADVGASGWNALHYAAFNGRTEILRLLVERDAPLDAKAPNGQTALMLAAAAGHLEAVEILVDADADMDLEDSNGATALALARKAGRAPVADFLETSGAEE